MLNSSSKNCNLYYSNRKNKKPAKSVLTLSSEKPCNTLNGLHENV